MPRILIEQKDFLVLDKPSGLHSVHQKNSDSPSLESWVIKTFSAQKELTEGGLVHRLDFETSGCLLVARNEESYRYYRNEMKSSRLKKFYLAEVSLSDWLKKDADASREFTLFFSSRYRGSEKVTVKPKGETQERGQARWSLFQKGHSSALLKVELIGPGRRHQIRAGLSYCELPLLGDSLYRGEDRGRPFFLHAWKLECREFSAVSDARLKDWQNFRKKN